MGLGEGGKEVRTDDMEEGGHLHVAKSVDECDLASLQSLHDEIGQKNAELQGMQIRLQVINFYSLFLITGVPHNRELSFPLCVMCVCVCVVCM